MLWFPRPSYVCLLSLVAMASFGAAATKLFAAQGLMVHVQLGGSGTAGRGTREDVTEMLAKPQRLKGLLRDPDVVTGGVRAPRGCEADLLGKPVFPVAATYGVARVRRDAIWIAVVTLALHLTIDAGALSAERLGTDISLWWLRCSAGTSLCFSKGDVAPHGRSDLFCFCRGVDIRRLCAAGEVTAGLSGGNVLGLCSLLN